MLIIKLRSNDGDQIEQIVQNEENIRILDITLILQGNEQMVCCGLNFSNKR